MSEQRSGQRGGQRPYGLTEDQFVLERVLLSPIDQARYLEDLDNETAAQVFDAAAQLYEKIQVMHIAELLEAEWGQQFLEEIRGYPVWVARTNGALLAACLQTARIWATG